jgi:hypothetical protein
MKCRSPVDVLGNADGVGYAFITRVAAVNGRSGG